MGVLVLLGLRLMPILKSYCFVTASALVLWQDSQEQNSAYSSSRHDDASPNVQCEVNVAVPGTVKSLARACKAMQTRGRILNHAPLIIFSESFRKRVA